VELLALLEPLTPSEWSRSATVKRSGKVLTETVRSYAERLAMHEHHHLVGAAVATSATAQGPATPSGPDTAALRKLETVLSFLRQRNTADYAVTTREGIDEARFVELGGIERWITIRGENRGNPIPVVLHGGPGDVINPWAYTGFRPWLKHFTIVQWDQRGAGRTLGRNGPSLGPTITIERMTLDGIELVNHLRRALGQDKVILLGHSWGSTLGVYMVKRRPELFHAFVGTGQVADPARNYSVAYDDVLRAAERRGESRALRELREIGPPPWPDRRGFGVQRKWANLFEHADAFLASTLGLALTAPGYSAKDINDWFDGQGLSGSRLVPQTSVLTSADLGGRFAVPVFVIHGAEDFTTPTSLARGFVESISAPQKEFVAIPGAGHFAVFTQPDVFLQELVSRVLSLAGRR
jgi:pimeloyl-ACP methyl ester carboxylesterase